MKPRLPSKTSKFNGSPAISDEDATNFQHGKGCCSRGLWECFFCSKHSYLLYLALFILIGYIGIIFIYRPSFRPHECTKTCRFELVESIPENLTFPAGSPSHTSTFDAWSTLLSGAQKQVDLAVFYWSLTSKDVEPGSDYPSAWQGEKILQQIKDVGLQSNVSIRIAQNAPTKMSPQDNSEMLRKAGAAEVRNVDIHKLLGGVLHTKMWLVDDDKLYVGSANMDFRSLTQVKELGVLISHCSCLVNDMRKIFEEYWEVGGTHKIPTVWPDRFNTDINLSNPVTVTFNGVSASSLISSSPPPFTSRGRTDDVDAIVAVIEDARKTVDIAVMDYFPRTLYTRHSQFWPVLDNALRAAAVNNGVHVRVLGSHWSHTRADMVHWLQSLQDISATFPHITVEAKLFVVPAYTDEQKQIPFGRVNHNKYMVTDRIAYIGTSNWSGDYFTDTGGVGIIVNETLSHSSSADATSDDDGQPSLRAQLQAVFDRDWNSEYARPLFQFTQRNI